MRELELTDEPIVDNLPGTNYIYIDLPRDERKFAPLKPVLEQYDRDTVPPYAFPAGVSPSGEVEWISIPDLPHMLVAGATGSGKSVFLYTLIYSLTRFYSADEIEMVLVDPKRTDFILFSKLPHLRDGDVITDPDRAVEKLTVLINEEVDRRTEILEDALYQDIYSFNEDHPENAIKPTFVVIDEFADLSDVLGDGEEAEQFNTALRRLAQRARSVGIHLVIATQRPTADIIDGTIKANLPCRISFRLSSNTDSRTILDEGGAENLLGNGDMLVRRGGELKRLQGLFISDDELRAAMT
jgi:DNA segregation ATPase FtsK/SpoIIIE-like protein